MPEPSEAVEFLFPGGFGLVCFGLIQVVEATQAVGGAAVRAARRGCSFLLPPKWFGSAEGRNRATKAGQQPQQKSEAAEGRYKPHGPPARLTQAPLETAATYDPAVCPCQRQRHNTLCLKKSKKNVENSLHSRLTQLSPRAAVRCAVQGLPAGTPPPSSSACMHHALRSAKKVRLVPCRATPPPCLANSPVECGADSRWSVLVQRKALLPLT